MSDELLAFLNSHASVRQFTDRQISAEDEARIIETAERSPTSSNLHAWSVVSIRDDAKKKTLAELTGKQAHVAQASVFMVWLADLYRLQRLAEAREYRSNVDFAESFVIAVVDCALAACRGLMAAQAMGMGGVMVGGIRNHIEEVTTLLKLPKFVTPVMGMSLGYPAKEAKIKPRLPIAGLAFKETYDTEAIDAAVAAYDETIAQLGYLEGREVEPEKYAEFEGSYSWSEHTARRMATTNPITRREHLLDFLHQQGFLRK